MKRILYKIFGVKRYASMSTQVYNIGEFVNRAFRYKSLVVDIHKMPNCIGRQYYEYELRCFPGLKERINCMWYNFNRWLYIKIGRDCTTEFMCGWANVGDFICNDNTGKKMYVYNKKESSNGYAVYNLKYLFFVK